MLNLSIEEKLVTESVLNVAYDSCLKSSRGPGAYNCLVIRVAAASGWHAVLVTQALGTCFCSSSSLTHVLSLSSSFQASLLWFGHCWLESSINSPLPYTGCLKRQQQRPGLSFKLQASRTAPKLRAVVCQPKRGRRDLEGNSSESSVALGCVCVLLGDGSGHLMQPALSNHRRTCILVAQHLPT